MNLSDLTKDLPGVDPRARGKGKGLTEQNSDSVLFAGLLSDLDASTTPAPGGKISIDATASIAGEDKGSVPSEAVITMKVPTAQFTASTNFPSTERVQDPKEQETKSVDTLIGRFFEDVALNASSSGKDASSKPANKSAAKEESTKTTPDGASAGQGQVAPSLDLIALLLGSPGPANEGHVLSSTSEAAVRSGSEIDALPVRTEIVEDKTLAAGPKPIVSDIAVRTYAAPVAATPTYAETATIVAAGASPEIAQSSPATVIPAALTRPRQMTLPPSSQPEPRPSKDTGRSVSSSLEVQEDDAQKPTVPLPASSEKDPSANQHNSDYPEPSTTLRSRPESNGPVEAPRFGTAVTVVSKLADPMGVTTQRNAAPPTQSAVMVAPARTLTLQMEQGDLGPVAVRMHLAGQELDLQLTTSDRQTLAELNRNRDDLASAIGDRHYQLHSIVIQDGGSISTSAANHTGSENVGREDRPDIQGTGDQRGERRDRNHDQRRQPENGGRSDSAQSSHSDSNHCGSSLFV